MQIYHFVTKALVTKLRWLLLVLLYLFNTNVFAADSLQSPSLNPAFVKYQQLKALGIVKAQTTNGHPLGYIPPPVDLPQVPTTTSHLAIKANTFPAKYDLRALGRVTPVRNQGACGDCWAHGAYGSLESFLKPTENRDFSEAHLNDYNGFDFGWCEGGNNDMSAAYMTRWKGPLNDTDYPQPSLTSDVGLSIQKHVQNVDFLPQRTNYLDNNDIKAAIVNTGAVTMAYYHNDYYFNASTNAYYNPKQANTNHLITIVGWDDNFSKNNFTRIPPSDGAFIVKNSWGTAWGEQGYFYISYYDAVLNDAAAFNNAEPVTNYARSYEYDALGQTSYFWFNTSDAWFANVFTADANTTTIAAASFYTLAPNTTYNVSVYRDVTAGKPNSGTLVASASGSINYAGYHTVKFSTPASVTPGKNFAVVVRFTGNPYIPVESPINGYSSKATASAGQSYVASNGTSWSDITSFSGFTKTNVTIKAFAGTATAKPLLNVSKTGTGVGTVSSNPTGIACGTDCSEAYTTNTVVTLTAQASAGSAFTGWSGACSGTATTCSVTISTAQTVTAQFDLVTYSLDITKVGNGTVNSNPAGISCGTDCSEAFKPGTKVTLTATPDTNYTFAGWSGACTGTTSTCTVTMNAAQAATATFKPKSTPTLIVSTVGNGTIVSLPSSQTTTSATSVPDISCGADCSENYSVNSVVTLVATPVTGYKFSAWSGACTGNTSTCTVTMSAAKTVKATFTP